MILQNTQKRITLQSLRFLLLKINLKNVSSLWSKIVLFKIQNRFFPIITSSESNFTCLFFIDNTLTTWIDCKAYYSQVEGNLLLQSKFRPIFIPAHTTCVQNNYYLLVSRVPEKKDSKRIIACLRHRVHFFAYYLRPKLL